MLVKKKAYGVDKAALLKIIENAVDTFVKVESKVGNNEALDQDNVKKDISTKKTK